MPLPRCRPHHTLVIEDILPAADPPVQHRSQYYDVRSVYEYSLINRNMGGDVELVIIWGCSVGNENHIDGVY